MFFCRNGSWSNGRCSLWHWTDVLCGCRKERRSADGADADTQTETGRTKTDPVPRYGRDGAVHPFDGESLCMMAEDGTKEIGICRFVDEKQVDVNGQIWEIGEFLWQMERRGIQVYPLETAEKKKR